METFAFFYEIYLINMPHFNILNKISLLFEEYCKQAQIDGKEINATISNIDLKLRVASTPISQAQGYSIHPEPSDNEGILFVYSEDQPLSFWMKDVDFPLDIIFFDSECTYIHHETMQPGDLESKYRSTKPARFAVELKSGWCNKNLTNNCKLLF
jgi:uncharacterized membrane protein (UPF0127 family)